MNGPLIILRTHTHRNAHMHAHMHTASTNTHMHSQTSGGSMLYTSRGLHVVSSDDVQSQWHLLHAGRGRVDTLVAFIQNDIDSLVEPLQLSLKGQRRGALCHTYLRSMANKANDTSRGKVYIRTYVHALITHLSTMPVQAAAYCAK